jgi:hypothetical protein
MSSPFAITAPSTTVHLAENRLGKMPFTITNMTDRQVSGTVTVVPIDTAPLEWFSPAKSEITLAPRASTQVLVKVEPPLGVTGGTHLFRVDVDDPATPEENVTGPSCSVVVPPSVAKFSFKTPRGYLATLLGATAGGALGELIIFLLFFRGPGQKDCGTDFGCALGNVLAEIFFLIVGILLGLVVLWVGAVVGAGIALRIKEYLGSVLTSVFLAVLMVPWTIAMLWLLPQITDNLTVLMIIAPILLTSVPGVIARGAVLLIRTKHL